MTTKLGGIYWKARQAVEKGALIKHGYCREGEIVFSVLLKKTKEGMTEEVKRELGEEFSVEFKNGGLDDDQVIIKEA